MEDDRESQRFSLLPRYLQFGPLKLDLLHRDGLVGRRWLGLFPREFELLWRLAETPDQAVSKGDLLRDVWRLERDPGTNRLEVAISRIRAKLHVFRLSAMIRTEPTGGYCLKPDADLLDRKPDISNDNG